MIEEHDWPRAHLVMDDFFSPSALKTIFKEVESLEKKLKPGLVRDIGHDGQSVFFEHARRRNKAVWIHEPSKTLDFFRSRLWAPELCAAFSSSREPLFQIIPNCWAPHLQVSTYVTGDHYDFHEDEGAGVNLTAIVFLGRNPKKLRGGDLVIDYEGEETIIPFQTNRLVIFPSKTLHRVTEVTLSSRDPRDARISLQAWLTYGQPAKTKKAPPEADQPTFLLAEKSILRAAQAMIDWKTAQTPEDVYWGAFYLSRILSSNLRALALQNDLVLGEIEIIRAGSTSGTSRHIEVAASAGKNRRVGFELGSALSLFFEARNGKRTRVRVPANASEEACAALLAGLLAH